MKLKNVNPLGAVDLPLIGRTLDAGEVFEVDDKTGAVLLKQVGNYERAGAPRPPRARKPKKVAAVKVVNEPAAVVAEKVSK